jgi:hypothetical protein
MKPITMWMAEYFQIVFDTECNFSYMNIESSDMHQTIKKTTNRFFLAFS